MINVRPLRCGLFSEFFTSGWAGDWLYTYYKMGDPLQSVMTISVAMMFFVSVAVAYMIIMAW